MDGARLKKKRIEKGLSLSKLSDMTGISKSYLSLIERGIQKNPSLDMLGKITKSLDVEVDYFLKAENKEIYDTSNFLSPIKSTFKLEIELSEEQLNPENINRIKDVLNTLIKDMNDN